MNRKAVLLFCFCFWQKHNSNSYRQTTLHALTAHASDHLRRSDELFYNSIFIINTSDTLSTAELRRETAGRHHPSNCVSCRRHLDKINFSTTVHYIRSVTTYSSHLKMQCYLKELTTDQSIIANYFEQHRRQIEMHNNNLARLQWISCYQKKPHLDQNPWFNLLTREKNTCWLVKITKIWYANWIITASNHSHKTAELSFFLSLLWKFPNSAESIRQVI